VEPVAEEPHALVEQRGPILIVTMNRPRVRNALSAEMLAIMGQAWDRVDADPRIRACVLTGAGGAFCAGADLKAMTRSHPGDGFRNGGADLSRIDALLKGRRLSKPLVAAVEGPAVAGGTEILQATEVRVAGDTAEFGISEVQRGLFPLGGSTVRLQRQIAFTNAADLLLTGRRISAQEAKEMGLIGHVVPAGQALTKARELADLIAANGPLAVKAVLRSMRETAAMSEADGLAHELTIGEPIIFGTNDAKEGPKAFAEKRKPVFTGT